MYQPVLKTLECTLVNLLSVYRWWSKFQVNQCSQGALHQNQPCSVGLMYMIDNVVMIW